MHAREIGRERPKFLPFKGERERERGKWEDEMDNNLSCDGQYKREKAKEAQMQWRLHPYSQKDSGHFLGVFTIDKNGW